MKRFTLLVAACLALVASEAEAGAFESSFYYPIEPEEFSTFLVDDLVAQTETVLGGFENVDGVPTRVVETSGGEYDGRQVNVTNDILGVRVHRNFVPDLFIEGVGFVDRTVTFVPPWKRNNPSFDLGEIIEASGTAVFEFSDGSSFARGYEAAVRAVAIEQVTVPLGTFDALKIQESLTLLSGSESFTNTDISWRVPGLGVVKEQITEEVASGVFETRVLELVTTNREFVPEPSVVFLRLAALCSVGVVVRKRRRRFAG